MLSEEEKQEIEAEFPHYLQKQAVCIDAMQIVQRHRGWVSDEAIADLAQFLDMTPEELDGVATFYNLIYRKPVGRHIILICNSITCWAMGYGRLANFFKTELGLEAGGTTPDGRFTLIPNPCLGICDHAPALMIDEDTHTDLTEDRLREILSRYP